MQGGGIGLEKLAGMWFEIITVTGMCWRLDVGLRRAIDDQDGHQQIPQHDDAIFQGSG